MARRLAANYLKFSMKSPLSFSLGNLKRKRRQLRNKKILFSCSRTQEAPPTSWRPKNCPHSLKSRRGGEAVKTNKIRKMTEFPAICRSGEYAEHVKNHSPCRWKGQRNFHLSSRSSNSTRGAAVHENAGEARSPGGSLPEGLVGLKCLLPRKTSGDRAALFYLGLPMNL